MATKKKRATSKLEQRYKDMSSEEVEKRWRDMRPRYFKWLGLFVSLACITFLLNHVFLMQHSAAELRVDGFYTKTIGVLNVAFQISCIFTFLFTTLVSMSYFYGRPSAKQTAH